MKILDIPQSGKCGTFVSYRSPFGQCRRQLVCPKNNQTDARQRARRDFGHWSRAWSALLTQEQRDAWNLAGPKVQSRKRLGQSGSLSGAQHFQGINSARACIGRSPLLLPPEPVVFDPSPVGPLIITNGADGVRLLLQVTGPVTEDIMVFGQAPCSCGRSKRRNVSYLGLLPAAEGGFSDITPLYVARFGEPPAGQRVFIVTRQQKNGWEDDDRLTHTVVPGLAQVQQPPASEASQAQPSAPTAKPPVQQAIPEPALPLTLYMHKGCTPGAEATGGRVRLEEGQGAEEGGPGRELSLGGRECD